MIAFDMLWNSKKKKNFAKNFQQLKFLSIILTGYWGIQILVLMKV